MDCQYSHDCCLIHANQHSTPLSIFRKIPQSQIIEDTAQNPNVENSNVSESSFLNMSYHFHEKIPSHTLNAQKTDEQKSSPSPIPMHSSLKPSQISAYYSYCKPVNKDLYSVKKKTIGKYFGLLVIVVPFASLL